MFMTASWCGFDAKKGRIEAPLIPQTIIISMLNAIGATRPQILFYYSTNSQYSQYPAVLTPAPPTITVLMNGLSSSCVLATTTVPTAASPRVRRLATGGLLRLVPLPTGTTWLRIPATSTPRVTVGVATALLCAA